LLPLSGPDCADEITLESERKDDHAGGKQQRQKEKRAEALFLDQMRP
jgi:hypothetical protein